MKVVVALWYLALSTVNADGLVSYLSIYADNPSGVAPVTIEPTGVFDYDEYLNLLSSDPRLSLSNVVASPLYLLVPGPPGLTQYYAHYGLRSILREPSLRPVLDYIKAGDKTGLVFRPATSRDPNLLNLTVALLVTPDHFQVGDLFNVLIGNQQIPFLLVTDRFYLDKLNLKSVKCLGRLGLSEKDKVYQ